MATTTASNYWTATANATAPHVTAVSQHKTQEQEEEARWNQHKYGLCPICKIGLDDRADFTFNYKRDLKNGTMMCHDCSRKEYENVETCRNCQNIVGGSDILTSTWDRKTRKMIVRCCRFC